MRPSWGQRTTLIEEVAVARAPSICCLKQLYQLMMVEGASGAAGSPGSNSRSGCCSCEAIRRAGQRVKEQVSVGPGDAIGGGPPVFGGAKRVGIWGALEACTRACERCVQLPGAADFTPVPVLTVKNPCLLQFTQVVTIYYALQDPRTSLWARLVILGVGQWCLLSAEISAAAPVSADDRAAVVISSAFPVIHVSSRTSRWW